MVSNDSRGLTLTGKDRFQGFNVDVVRALSAMLNFRYELYVVGDDRSVRKDSTVSDKVVRELTEGVSMSTDLPVILLVKSSHDDCNCICCDIFLTYVSKLPVSYTHLTLPTIYSV